MRTLSLTALLLLAAALPAAPGLPDKPPKWEYAELYYRSVAGRPRGVDADGKEVPATPPTAVIRWTTTAGDVAANGWDDLAARLKAPGFKKDTSAAHQRIQMLNYLGSEGWELIDHNAGAPTGIGVGERGVPGGGRGTPGATTWLLKRRVP
jgi:hypothetical protein